MQTIYKYEVPIGDEVVVSMPDNAKILTVQVQGMVPYIWALVETTNTVVKRRLAWRGTGHRVGDLRLYVGTVQLHGGALVFHLFDRGN